MKKEVMDKNFGRILIALAMVRIALALLPSFMVDMGAWLGWAERLRDLPLASFYSDNVWTQYTPGYLYYLWLIGKVGWIDPLAIKLSVIAADVGAALIVIKIVGAKKLSEKAIIASAYILNPVMIMVGSIWGQIDGILALLMIAAVYTLLEKKYILSAIVLSVAILTKLQAVAILPIYLFYLIKSGSGKVWLQTTLAGGFTQILGYYPFYPVDPIGGMIRLATLMRDSYPYTSLFAFNGWAYAGMWVGDATEVYGISYLHWGVVAIAAAYFALLLLAAWVGHKRASVYGLASISVLIFYLFPTRVHERYLVPFFVFMTAYIALNRSWKQSVILGLFSILYTLNLYLPYSTYELESNALKSVRLEASISRAVPVLIPFYYLMLGNVVLRLAPGWKKRKERIPISFGGSKAIEHGSHEDKAKHKE